MQGGDVIRDPMDYLLKALLLPEPQARQAWERWRASIDVNTMSYGSQQLLPALIPVFPEWLNDDPAAGILQGIVRRVWTQNQFRLRKAIEVGSLLTQADVQPVIAGPLAWSLRAKPPAIRVIPHLTFLVPRANVGQAAKVLVDDGWERLGDMPLERVLARSVRVCFRRENLQLNLIWRLVVVPPEDGLECERALLSRIDHIEWNHQTVQITSREATLLEILAGQRDCDLPWQADLATVGTTALDWPTFFDLARRFAPLAIDRLRELRSFSRLAIPPLPADIPGPLRSKYKFILNAYRAHGYRRREPLTVSGFAEFLAIKLAQRLRR